MAKAHKITGKISPKRPASQACARLRQLRGTVRFTRTLKELKADR